MFDEVFQGLQAAYSRGKVAETVYSANGCEFCAIKRLVSDRNTLNTSDEALAQCVVDAVFHALQPHINS